MGGVVWMLVDDVLGEADALKYLAVRHFRECCLVVLQNREA